MTRVIINIDDMRTIVPLLGELMEADGSVTLTDLKEMTDRLTDEPSLSEDERARMADVSSKVDVYIKQGIEPDARVEGFKSDFSGYQQVLP